MSSRLVSLRVYGIPLQSSNSAVVTSKQDENDSFWVLSTGDTIRLEILPGALKGGGVQVRDGSRTLRLILPKMRVIIQNRVNWNSIPPGLH